MTTLSPTLSPWERVTIVQPLARLPVIDVLLLESGSAETAW